MVRNGEIACYKKYLLFSPCCLSDMALIFSFQMHFKISSAVCFNFDQSKILSSGNELKKVILYLMFSFMKQRNWSQIHDVYYSRFCKHKQS